MKTVTFDPAVYKLVPVTPTVAMCNAAESTGPAGSVLIAGRAMLAAVPDADQLPGVVEHSGEPAAYRVEHRPGRYTFMEAKHYDCNKGLYEGARFTALYLHPAPSQPSAEALVQAALEAAALACDEISGVWGRFSDPSRSLLADQCAQTIRALSAQQIIESCKGEKS